jgi:enoyl-CoA hydratase/carnithine racemase
MQKLSKFIQRNYTAPACSPQTILKINKTTCTASIQLGTPTTHNYNVLSFAKLQSLNEDLDTIHQPEYDQIQKFVIFTDKPHFSSGADMRELLHPEDQRPCYTEYFNLLFDVIRKIQNSPKKSFSVFSGFTIGGGAAVGLSSDFNVCLEDALFKLSGSSVGLGTFDSCYGHRWPQFESTGENFEHGKMIMDCVLNASGVMMSGCELQGIFIDQVISKKDKKVREIYKGFFRNFWMGSWMERLRISRLTCTSLMSLRETRRRRGLWR